MSRRTSRGSAKGYPRTARLNHLLQEIIGDEVERIDDDRLGLLTVVAVEVEGDLRHATVHYSALGDEGAPVGDDDPVAEALAEHRGRLQSAIARQARLKRTPELVFRPDRVVRQAERVEEILRDISASPSTSDARGAPPPDPRS